MIALAGSAIAAKKYVITSKKQIAPKVLKQLKGKTGPEGRPGPAGPMGATGATGAKGDTGAAGPKGDTGATGTNGTNGTDGTSGGAATTRQTLAGEVTTINTTETDLGGPSVTVNIATDGTNVQIGATAEVMSSDGAQAAIGRVFADGVPVPYNPFYSVATSYTAQQIQSLYVLSAGSHTFLLKYRGSGGATASFRNRTLIVSVLG